jgi:HSP20 family protein
MVFGRPAPWRRGSSQVERSNPFREVERTMRDMDRWMEGFFGGGFPSIGRSLFPSGGPFPNIDMYEEKDRYVVKAEVPGVEKDDIHVSVVDNTLQIRGETKKKESVREQDYYYSERYAGSFSRIIPLPAVVKADDIKATFKDGVLTLELPKAKEALEKEIKIDVK